MSDPIVDIHGYFHPPGGATGALPVASMSIADLVAWCDRLKGDGRAADTIPLYEAWLAFYGDSPASYFAYFNLAVALSESGRKLAAAKAMRECLRVNPEFAQARINLGRLFEDVGRGAEAVGEWRKGIDKLAAATGEAVGHKWILLTQSARLLESHSQDAAAEALLAEAIELEPGRAEAVRQWIGLRTRLCLWPAIAATPRMSMKEKLATIWPLSLANLSDDPLFQLACAYKHAKLEFATPPSRSALETVQGARPDSAGRRLRVGYVSSDLREHAVGLALTQLFEKHDRHRFEIFAYYCGIERDDAIRRRIVAAVEHWVDISHMNDSEAALRIAADGVDILVDLNGYTKFSRTPIFALRPAPVQVNWFGFPATMGTPYHHYLIADPVIIPEGDEIFYTEEVVRVACYQPNDRQRVVATRTPERAEFGLPQNAFVFCTFNGSQKLTQRMFDLWLDILAVTPNTVLWMLKGTDDANARLVEYATGRGLARERLIFADKIGNPEHLARYACADLFLDSFPYGAHTTASDALWMGCPVLTLTGRSFAARVCTSLVTAAGAPELAASNEGEYRAKAILFAINRAAHAELKRRLWANRETSLLFDIDRLAASLEDAYATMARRWREGRTPRPNFANLDAYHDVALNFEPEGGGVLTREAYLSRYRAALADYNLNYPLLADGRLWPPGEAASAPA